VAFGVIRLGPAGERMWKGGDTEFCAMVRAMGTLLLGFWEFPMSRFCRLIVVVIISWGRLEEVNEVRFLPLLRTARCPVAPSSEGRLTCIYLELPEAGCLPEL